QAGAGGDRSPLPAARVGTVQAGGAQHSGRAHALRTQPLRPVRSRSGRRAGDRHRGPRQRVSRRGGRRPHRRRGRHRAAQSRRGEKVMTTLAPIDAATCVVRNTGSRRGRHVSVTPATTAARHLHFGRIVLDAGEEVSFSTEDRETALICLGGAANVSAGFSRPGDGPAEAGPYMLTRYDALYLTRDTQLTLRGGADGCDFAQVAAPGGNE